MEDYKSRETGEPKSRFATSVSCWRGARARPCPSLWRVTGSFVRGGGRYPTQNLQGRVCPGPSEGYSRAFPTLRADTVAMPVGPQVESRVSGSAGGVDTQPGPPPSGKADGALLQPQGALPQPLRGRAQSCETWSSFTRGRQQEAVGGVTSPSRRRSHLICCASAPPSPGCPVHFSYYKELLCDPREDGPCPLKNPKSRRLSERETDANKGGSRFKRAQRSAGGLRSG